MAKASLIPQPMCDAQRGPSPEYAQCGDWHASSCNCEPSHLSQPRAGSRRSYLWESDTGSTHCRCPCRSVATCAKGEARMKTYFGPSIGAPLWTELRPRELDSGESRVIVVLPQRRPGSRIQQSRAGPEACFTTYLALGAPSLGQTKTAWADGLEGDGRWVDNLSVQA